MLAFGEYIVQHHDDVKAINTEIIPGNMDPYRATAV